MNLIRAIIIGFIFGDSFAVLEVTVLKKQKNAFPIVITPFASTADLQQGRLISQIMSDNFNRSGEFNANKGEHIISDIENIDFDKWHNQKIEALVFGSIESVSKKIFNVQIHLVDIYSKKQLYAEKITVHNSGIRRVAHFLSDQIYFALLGKKGSFYTRLSYVTVLDKGNGAFQYRLEIAHSDAQKPQTIITSPHPILSPVWSPDQSKIAYVSFENNRSEVFIRYPFVRRKVQKLPYFDGIASSPSWHPDGQSLLLTLSKNGNKDIYTFNLQSEKLTRLTFAPSIDTEASYSADGKRIVFTSNRSGQVQVYIKDLHSNTISRATFRGSYNAKAVFSPDGEQLALVHRIGGDYRIALLDIKSKDLTIMSKNHLDESPYFSPSGDMIIFATNKKDTGLLSVVSLAGRQVFELAAKVGEVREPNWSNYSQQ